MGFSLSVLCSWYPKDRNKPLIFAEAAETGFCLFKEQVPFKSKKKYQRFNAKGRPFCTCESLLAIPLNCSTSSSSHIFLFIFFLQCLEIDAQTLAKTWISCFKR
jgi:hypothetical protein